MITRTFEDFLREEYFKDYIGHKEGFEDAFDRWLEGLQADDLIKYADQYAKQRREKLVQASQLAVGFLLGMKIMDGRGWHGSVPLQALQSALKELGEQYGQREEGPP